MKRLLLPLLLVTACSKEQPAPPAPPPAAPQAPAAQAPSTDTGLGAPATPRSSQAGEQAYVTGVVSLRRLATDERQIDDPTGKAKKKIANFLTSLHRGEQVSVLKVQDKWAQVRASDDKEGWLEKDRLLPTEGVSMATVFQETKTFDRPDLLALNGKRKLDPGALLFVLKTKDQFSEINVGGATTAWVLTSDVSTEAREVEASKLLGKARWLTERKDESAAALMDLAKSQFGDTKIMQAAATAEAAPADGAAKPEGAPADGAAPAPAEGAAPKQGG
jgi:SH3-like domain-containing protein